MLRSGKKFAACDGGPSQADIWCTPARLPEVYRSWHQTEVSIIASLLARLNLPDRADERIVDLCCGAGRLIGPCLRLASSISIIGVDNDRYSLERAASRITLMSGKACDRVQLIPAECCSWARCQTRGAFSVGICAGNSFGVFLEDSAQTLRTLASLFRHGIILSVIAKGNSRVREEYYRSFDIAFERDPTAETFYSEVWGSSRAYSKLELEKLAADAGVQVRSIHRATKLGWVMHVAESRKESCR